MPGKSGEILLWGPAQAVPASETIALTLPADWVTDEVLALTPAGDFLGSRRLFDVLAASLKPWAIRPLPLASGDPAAGADAAVQFARAAVSAAARGAHVLVVTADRPWNDPVGQAIVRARALDNACVPDKPPPGGCSFALQVVEAVDSPRALAQTPLDKLEAIMVRLLAPGGCPWDREQTHNSLRPYVVEEAAEVIEAIERGTPGKLVDELGDLLLQIAFHAALASETGDFTLADVARAIEGKMLYRHPHVFADWEVSGAQEVLRNWDVLKASEAAATGDAGDPGPWRPLRKAAVRVSLAAINVAFAVARGDTEGAQAARRDLEDQTTALLAAARDDVA